MACQRIAWSESSSQSMVSTPRWYRDLRPRIFGAGEPDFEAGEPDAKAEIVPSANVAEQLARRAR